MGIVLNEGRVCSVRPCDLREGSMAPLSGLQSAAYKRLLQDLWCVSAIQSSQKEVVPWSWSYTGKVKACRYRKAQVLCKRTKFLNRWSLKLCSHCVMVLAK